jgi:kynurenine 3-monooxygenase
MTLAEEEGAEIKFNQRCARVDVAGNTLYIEETSPEAGNLPSNQQSAPPRGDRNPESEIKCDLLFGADGAFSSLRTAYAFRDRVSARQDYIDYGYKELNIPPGPASQLWLMEKEALHIWPRGAFMLIALPNTDGSFTCTLFAPFEGPKSFAALGDSAAVRDFFEANFADIIPIMPDYAAQMERNPVASLITTHISQWHFGDKSALIGDAAHAIVPFYGQGMNAGFEDCSVLWNLLKEHGDGDWNTILTEYQRLRKPAGDAVGELALQNFIEMRDKVADPRFLQRKKWEKELGLRYPGKFNSVYEMVSFSHTPYHTALQCTKAQDVLLERILNDPEKESEFDQWVEEYHSQVKDLDFGGEMR